MRDTRRLSGAAQEDLRRRAVATVKGGMTQTAVSTVFNVAPNWIEIFTRLWMGIRCTAESASATG